MIGTGSCRQVGGLGTMAVAMIVLFAACGGVSGSDGAAVETGTHGTGAPAAAGGGPVATARIPATAAPVVVVPSAVPPTEAFATTAPSAVVDTPAPPPFRIRAGAFGNGDAIPRRFTCDGADSSPELSWTGVPDGTRALVLVVDDPDAGGFVHWTVLDLPGADGSLAAGIEPEVRTPRQGRNDFGTRGWGGPCPPSGTHHYDFTLYALTAPLALDGAPSGADVKAALRAAGIIAQARLRATYRR